MSSRPDMTGAFLRSCFGIARKNVSKKKLLEWVLDELASVERDIDKCGEMDTHAYYTGMSDAFNMVAQWIAPFKDEESSQRYHDILGLQGPNTVPEGFPNLQSVILPSERNKAA